MSELRQTEWLQTKKSGKLSPSLTKKLYLLFNRIVVDLNQGNTFECSVEKGKKRKLEEEDDKKEEEDKAAPPPDEEQAAPSQEAVEESDSDSDDSSDDEM